MKTKLQNFNLPVDLIKNIENIGGLNSKTSTVISLLEQAISMRSVDEQTLNYMYEGAKQSPSFNHGNKEVRAVIDGLNI
ncbi:MAG TPA: hypothetical protein EYN67_11025 [Flavobacteriales bacterium]|nr:hypothetical protein [Methylococcaceae bacterium]HHZ96063.1 hypothetical protein [Flavobacteriales bacterium]